MNTASLRTVIAERLARVEQRITAACLRTARHRSDVTLVAVTKKISPASAALLPELGLLELGENRPQELWRKAEALGPGVHWHLIGHLQRNKVERTLPLVTMIHSVDSVRLIDALEAEAGKQGRTVEALLEFNVSGEASKLGFRPEDVGAIAPELETLRHIRIAGLMTMAPLQDPEACRPLFARLRGLRDELRGLTPRHDVHHLSMGMTNDFEVAIEEGATLVRLGSVLFEGLDDA